MSKKVLLSALIAYILATAASFTFFFSISRAGITSTTPVSTPDDQEQETRLGALLDLDPGAPRDQPCPLNGKLYTQAERESWEKRRPIAIMIENSPDARPHSGLSEADIVFEAVAEGGVTRFMAMYYCDVQAYDTTLAPVRSARTYFVDYASGFNYPLYTNVGGANLPGPTDALGQISEYGWSLQNNINQFSVGYPTFIRNANRLGRPVATEHTMETSTEKLWAVAEERGWTNMSKELRHGRVVVPARDWQSAFEPWTFQESAPEPGTVTEIAHDFWSGYGQYSVVWKYDEETNQYAREMGGEPHLDLNNDEQVMASNVVVLLTTERGPINELKHMIYTTTGTGKALLFKNGEVVEANWSKPDRESELRFVDARGNDIALARGLTWISVVDQSTDVAY
ncbi:MAG: DUF3048 domain-containing protein [Patescibacteria group bacterium]